MINLFFFTHIAFQNVDFLLIDLTEVTILSLPFPKKLKPPKIIYREPGRQTSISGNKLTSFHSPPVPPTNTLSQPHNANSLNLFPLHYAHKFHLRLVSSHPGSSRAIAHCPGELHPHYVPDHQQNVRESPIGLLFHWRQLRCKLAFLATEA